MLLGATLAALFIALTAGPAAAADFPARDSRYHSVTEMFNEINAAQTRYPTLVRVFSIGKSHQGRTIWAAKISDQVAVDSRKAPASFGHACAEASVQAP